MNGALPTRSLRALLDGYADAVPELAVTSVALDSRAVTPGALFLAARGSTQHGLAHVEQALQHGAAAVAWEPAEGIDAPQLPVPAIAVADLARRAGTIAARFWQQPSQALHTIGITGTDGKTSTAYLIAQALDRLAQPCAYFGTIGYGRVGALADAALTTPDPVRLQGLFAAQRDADAVACAMEVSSHALDQGRVASVDFDTAVLTNVGRDHLDYHGTVDAYAAAKRRLFAWPGLRHAVLNIDDACGAQWLAELNATPSAAATIAYGTGAMPEQGQYVRATEIVQHATGLRLQLETHAGAATLESRLFGRFNGYNLMAALSALLAHGVALDAACAALAQSRTVPGRVESFQAEGGPLVVVDYAHTPQALTQVLAALRPHVDGRLFCIFGCGGDRDRGKRPLMGAAAVAGADLAIITDDNPRSEDPAAIVADIVAGLPAKATPAVIHDRAAAITSAVESARPGDIVLVAGKGHEDYQLYGRERRSFSDRAFVAGLLGVAVRT